jgi:hypothetical protein
MSDHFGPFWIILGHFKAILLNISGGRDVEEWFAKRNEAVLSLLAPWTAGVHAFSGPWTPPSPSGGDNVGMEAGIKEKSEKQEAILEQKKEEIDAPAESQGQMEAIAEVESKEEAEAEDTEEEEAGEEAGEEEAEEEEEEEDEDAGEGAADDALQAAAAAKAAAKASKEKEEE